MVNYRENTWAEHGLALIIPEDVMEKICALNGYDGTSEFAGKFGGEVIDYDCYAISVDYQKIKKTEGENFWGWCVKAPRQPDPFHAAYSDVDEAANDIKETYMKGIKLPEGFDVSEYVATYEFVRSVM